MKINGIQLFWADALKEGYKEIGHLDVPFKAEGCIHLKAELKLYFLTIATIKIAFCFR